ncbi:MAG: protein translocase subunit SecD [Dehalococcoidia bacterium]
MRRRSIQISALIVFILALSVASLAFTEIHVDIPGFPELDRAATGPLGLKLGPDLRGGGHLVYQADTGTTVNASYNKRVDDVDVRAALDKVDLGNLTLVQEDNTTFRIETDLLNSDQQQEVREALSGIDQFIAEVQFTEPIDDLSGVTEVVENLELEDFRIGREGTNGLLIRTSSLTEGQGQQLQNNLAEDVLEVASFEVTELELVTFQFSDTPAPTSDQMDGVLDIINRRVNLFGTEEPIIQRFGDDRIIVQLPGASGSVTDVEFAEDVAFADVEEVLQESGFEDFVIDQKNERNFKLRTVSLSPTQRQELQDDLAVQVGEIRSFEVTGGIEAAKALIGQTALLEFKERTCNDPACLSFNDADLGLKGGDLSDAFASADPNTGQWDVNIQFNSRGSEIFSDLTQRIVGESSKRISVFLDGELIIAPVSQAWIRNGRSRITGNFTREEARTLAIQLEAGSLPVPLSLIQESDVDALLGSESLEKSLMAGFVGLGLVLVFMIAYYRMAGVVAAVALIFYSLVVLAIFKLIPLTLTLPHIGGFILSIGLAVDANILIFERMKEEMRIGRTLASSMEVGFSRAWPAIRDSNVSTMITCGVLLWFGNRLGGGLVSGFALSLFVGVAVSMFTAVVVSRNLLQLLAWIGLSQRINLFTPEPIQARQATAGGRVSNMEGSR